jgi:predicted DNA-binding transcriptional regulator YafY
MRDLQGLQSAGFPIYDERSGREKLWKFVDGFKSRIPPPFNLVELMALYFARALCRPLEGTAIHESLQEAFSKISCLLPQESVRFLSELEGAIAARPGPFKDYSQYRDLIQTVALARVERRSLDIVYDSFARRQITRRRVDPYHLCYFQGGVYVIAHDHLREEIRIFALERMSSIEPTGSTFEVPEDFDFETYMESALGIFRGPAIEVKLKFAASLAPYVRERQWHASQSIEELPDGSLLLNLKVADSLELRRFVLSFGAEAEVLEPESLRREIREEAQALVDQLERWDMAPDQLFLPLLELGLPRVSPG